MKINEYRIFCYFEKDVEDFSEEFFVFCIVAIVDRTHHWDDWTGAHVFNETREERTRRQIGVMFFQQLFRSLRI